jgi:hypothetical protein
MPPQPTTGRVAIGAGSEPRPCAPLVADKQHRARGAEGEARERCVRGHALLAHRRARVARQVPHAHLPQATPAVGIGFLGAVFREAQATSGATAWHSAGARCAGGRYRMAGSGARMTRYAEPGSQSTAISAVRCRVLAQVLRRLLEGRVVRDDILPAHAASCAARHQACRAHAAGAWLPCGGGAG